MKVRQKDVWLSVLLICLMIPRILPLTREFEELAHYCEEENLYLVTGFDSSSHHTVWGSINCNDRGGDFVGNSKFFESGNSKSGQ